MNNSSDSPDLVTMDFLVAKRLYETSTRFFYNKLHVDLEKLPRKFLPCREVSVEQLEILEIGAGSGEHLNFVKLPFKRYTLTDISDLGLKSISSLLSNDKISFEKADAEDLPFDDSSFDRVVATCVLAHLENPLLALMEIRRVLRVGGTASIFLSADPSITLRAMRRFFVSPKMKNLPMEYGLYNALAHRNSCSNLLQISRHVFQNDLIVQRFEPFRVPAWNLSTHEIVHVKKIDYPHT